MDPAVTTPASQVPAVPSRARLAAMVLIRSVIFTALLGAAVFVPAGTWHFWQAWVFLPCWIVPVIVFLLFLVIVDPETAQRRMESGERDPTQRKVAMVAWPLFLAAIVAPGFDFRFGWTRHLLAPVPAWLSLAADVLSVAGILFGFWTVNVNRYAARTVRVEEGQQVVSSGAYRFIRHPMYAGMLLTILAMPVALGSIVTLPLYLLFFPFFLVRLLSEEKVLARDLPGYAEYCQRTRYHLIPFVW